MSSPTTRAAKAAAAASALARELCAAGVPLEQIDFGGGLQVGLGHLDHGVLHLGVGCPAIGVELGVQDVLQQPLADRPGVPLHGLEESLEVARLGQLSGFLRGQLRG